MTTQVRRLEDAGLVSRTVDPLDRLDEAERQTLADSLDVLRGLREDATAFERRI